MHKDIHKKSNIIAIIIFLICFIFGDYLTDSFYHEFRDIFFSTSRYTLITSHNIYAARDESAAETRKTETEKESKEENSVFCHWDNDEDMFDDDRIYSTSCDQEFILNDGTPKSNSMKFCCYCGKPIKAKGD